MSVNEKLVSLIQSLSQGQSDPHVLIRLLNQQFDRENETPWAKLNNGTLTKYLETESAFEVKKVGPGKHLVKLSGGEGGAPLEEKKDAEPTLIEEKKPQEEQHVEEQAKDSSTTTSLDEISEKLSDMSVSNKEDTKQTPKAPIPQKTARVVSRAPPRAATSNNSNLYNVDHEIQMLLEILRDMIPEGTDTIAYGEVFKSDAIQNSIESLSGTLKAAKKRGILHYQAELLMQGFSDKEIITVHRWTVQEE